MYANKFKKKNYVQKIMIYSQIVLSALQSDLSIAINNRPFWQMHNWYCEMPLPDDRSKPDKKIFFDSIRMSP